jgi:hypothetical protein
MSRKRTAKDAQLDSFRLPTFKYAIKSCDDDTCAYINIINGTTVYLVPVYQCCDDVLNFIRHGTSDETRILYETWGKKGYFMKSGTVSGDKKNIKQVVVI